MFFAVLHHVLSIFCSIAASTVDRGSSRRGRDYAVCRKYLKFTKLTTMVNSIFYHNLCLLPYNRIITDHGSHSKLVYRDGMCCDLQRMLIQRMLPWNNLPKVINPAFEPLTFWSLLRHPANCASELQWRQHAIHEPSRTHKRQGNRKLHQRKDY